MTKSDLCPFFVVTDHRCVIDGAAYPGIPIFFCETGVHEPVSEYFVWLGYECRRPPSTLKTYAYHILKFLKRIRDEGIEWQAVTDHVLIAWRDRMLDEEGLQAATVASYLESVFNFFRWAEETKRVRFTVPLYDETDPDGKLTYQISAKRRPNNELSWPYLPKVSRSLPRHTPTNPEIEQIHVEAYRGSNGQRDTLLLSMFEELYLRRAEALSLTVGDIPPWDALDDALVSKIPFTFPVLGKGAKVRYVTARPELMLRAREYIDETRADAVRKAQRRNAAYRAPNDLFLGSTTGQPLTKEHVSKHISRLMQKAGIQRASGHRLRASGLTALVLKYDRVREGEQPFPRDQLLLKVADAAGHERWETLEPYLALARTPVHSDETAQNLENIELIRDLRRENARLTAQIEKDKRM